MRVNLAIVECGNCGHMTKVALGYASAIACPACEITIVMGEADPEFATEEKTAQYYGGKRAQQ